MNVAELLAFADRCDHEMIEHTRAFLGLLSGPSRTSHRTAAHECASISAALRVLAAQEQSQ